MSTPPSLAPPAIGSPVPTQIFLPILSYPCPLLPAFTSSSWLRLAFSLLEPLSTSLPALCPLPPIQPSLASWSALLEAPHPGSQHLREPARISLPSLITHSFPFQTYQEPCPDHHRLPPTLCLCTHLGCSVLAGFGVPNWVQILLSHSLAT